MGELLHVVKYYHSSGATTALCILSVNSQAVLIFLHTGKDVTMCSYEQEDIAKDSS